jgi:hypothetical protein
VHFGVAQQRLPRNTSLDRNIATVAFNHVVVVSVHWIEDFRRSASAAKVCIALSVKFGAEARDGKTWAFSRSYRATATGEASIACPRTFARLLTIDALSEAPAFRILTSAFVFTWEERLSLFPMLCHILL